MEKKSIINILFCLGAFLLGVSSFFSFQIDGGASNKQFAVGIATLVFQNAGFSAIILSAIIKGSHK